jgi:hypothetical protein
LLPASGLPFLVNLPAARGSNDHDDNHQKGNQRRRSATDCGHNIPIVPSKPFRRALFSDHAHIGIVMSGNFEIFSDRRVLVDSEISGVGTNEAFIENSTRKPFKLLVFEGAK